MKKISKQKVVHQPVSLGLEIPRYVLQDHRGKGYDISELYGHPFVLFFYLSDQKTKCKQELASFQKNIAVFRDYGLSVLGVSIDSPKSHAKTIQDLALSYPLLFDYKFKLAKELGVAHSTKVGAAEEVNVQRTIFVIDSQQRIRHIFKPDPNESFVDMLIRDLPAILPENPT